MKPDFFNNLPSEVIINILSRLPILTIMRCKCVRKSWLYLLETREFVMTHLSRSVPGIAVLHTECEDTFLCRIFQFEDELDVERHELHYKPLVEFNLPYDPIIEGSTDGLLFLLDNTCYGSPVPFIHNLVTRNFIELDCLEEFAVSYLDPKHVVFGFGVSQMSGRYKVVRVAHDLRDEEKRKVLGFRESECHVYTLGTGRWRSIEPGVPFKSSYNRTGGKFLNGHLHWLVQDFSGSTWISRFNLETELFSTFFAPCVAPMARCNENQYPALSILRDCLCLCDNSSENEIIIWLMKEYSDEKSWTKEFILKRDRNLDEAVCPIKVFKDGDIIMSMDYSAPVYYSNKTKTINEIDMPELNYDVFMDVILHTPSFLSLDSFVMEKVSSF